MIERPNPSKYLKLVRRKTVAHYPSQGFQENQNAQTWSSLSVTRILGKPKRANMVFNWRTTAWVEVAQRRATSM